VLLQKDRQVTAEVLAHLAEVDARRLHVGLGFASLFSYCTGALGLSGSPGRVDPAAGWLPIRGAPTVRSPRLRRATAPPKVLSESNARPPTFGMVRPGRPRGARCDGVRVSAIVGRT
jgi:hypothetical protein